MGHVCISYVNIVIGVKDMQAVKVFHRGVMLDEDDFQGKGVDGVVSETVTRLLLFSVAKEI